MILINNEVVQAYLLLSSNMSLCGLRESLCTLCVKALNAEDTEKLSIHNSQLSIELLLVEILK